MRSRNAGRVQDVVVAGVRVKAEAGPKGAHYIRKIEKPYPRLVVCGSTRRAMRVVPRRLDFKEEYRVKRPLDDEDRGEVDGPALRRSLELGGWK